MLRKAEIPMNSGSPPFHFPCCSAIFPTANKKEDNFGCSISRMGQQKTTFQWAKKRIFIRLFDFIFFAIDDIDARF